MRACEYKKLATMQNLLRSALTLQLAAQRNKMGSPGKLPGNPNLISTFQQVIECLSELNILLLIF